MIAIFLPLMIANPTEWVFRCISYTRELEHTESQYGKHPNSNKFRNANIFMQKVLYFKIIMYLCT